jgi:uncharacterized membrane protein
MPDIAVFHPQIVHFVVALGFLGVLLRLVSLTGRAAWTDRAASLLLIIAAGAAVLAVISGDQAHGLAERIPGAREAVHEHEEYGEKARNVFLVVGLLELGALAFASRAGLAKGLRAGSAVVGLAACFFLYEAAEHGGELVYSYAGGIGTRSGNPEDVSNLLVAGLYHQARVKRQEGDSAEAARLIDELARQRPNDANVQLLQAEAALRDRKDPVAALGLLAGITPPEGDRFTPLRIGLLQADAHLAMGHADTAKAILSDLAAKYPGNRWVEEARARVQ